MRFALFECIVLFTSLLLSTCKPNDRVTSKDELVVYLDSLEGAYENACLAMGVANWNSYSKARQTDPPDRRAGVGLEGPVDLDSAKAMFARIFLDEKNRRTISEWHDKSSSLADELLARRLEMWHRCFLGGTIYADPEIAALENQLQKRITDFKFMLGGETITRAEISNRLREENNQQERHNLWQITGQLSSRAKDDLIRLVKLRNERAKKYGFPNYYSLALYLQTIDEGWLLKTLNSLEEQTRQPFQAFINVSKRKLHAKEIRPWDFDLALRSAASLPDKYFPSETVFSVLHRFEKGIGFAVDSLPIKEYVKDIPYGGLSLALKIPSDSRFLVNPTKGKGFYEVAFHEYGHSLQAVYTNVKYPILKGYEWIPGAQCAAYSEGVADFHKEFTDHHLWLTRFTKARPKEIEKYLSGKGLPVLYRLRKLLKDFFIEYEMYKNPDQDMAAVERAMYKKYLLVDMDKKDPHLFAANIWYTSYPCYFQNYILAGMIATQLQEALSSNMGDEPAEGGSNPKVASWIIERLYARGETAEWMERIREATGKSLETGAYLRKMGIVEEQ